jgi:hypothetical protein
MADLGFIPLIIWHPNTTLIVLWTYGPVLGTLGGDLCPLLCLQFAYCAVVMAEDFDAMDVCCETVVTCVEPEICNCLFSGFVFDVFES